MIQNPLSVLVINDDNEMRKNLIHSIEKSGHSGDMAGSSVEALMKLSQSDFDLALIDVDLHGEDGIELMGKVKVLYPELGIVAIAEVVSRFDQLRIRKQRVICILIKPFSMKVLRAILDHATKRKDHACDTGNMNFGRGSPKKR